ncbi:MAG: STAS domain-containing protein [Dokdonella sp.]
MNRDPAATVAVTDDGVLRLNGHIGYANADALLPVGRKALADGRVTQVDLAGLKSSDSATLAMLLAWAAEAARGKHRLVMSGAPDGLRALARLANVEALLQLS